MRLAFQPALEIVGGDGAIGEGAPGEGANLVGESDGASHVGGEGALHLLVVHEPRTGNRAELAMQSLHLGTQVGERREIGDEARVKFA
eukprot:2220089-Prymnesium_polylepis.2